MMRPRGPFENERSLRLPLGRGSLPGVSPLRGALAVALVACAIALAVAGRAAPWVRAVAALVFVGVAALVHRAPGRRQTSSPGCLVVDEDLIYRLDDAGRSPVVDLKEPFGVTVFADPSRSKFLLAFTSLQGVRYVAVRRTDGDEPRELALVLSRCVTATEGDLRGGDDDALTATNAGRLLAIVRERAPLAFDRLYLSDSTGEVLILDEGQLRVGNRRFELAEPLEWRASVFQERGPRATSVSQATWVRQGECEVVLVAGVPGEGGWLRGGDTLASRPAWPMSKAVRDCIASDLRLMQGAAAEPPPRETRRAIERMFMLPLRRALDAAPRMSRIDARRSRPEGRA
jgi:hypothetical protein